MTDWKGMNVKRTPVFPDSTLAQLAQNQRFKIKGEMQRRPALAASNLEQLGDPVLSLWQGADFGDYVISQTSGNLYGDRDPNMLWGETRLIPPIIIVGQPAFPVINSITPSPVSPGTYVAGQVSFLADVTYDGLSGPLVYSWQTANAGGAIPTIIVDNANPGIFDYNASCIPDIYNNPPGTLTVWPLLQPGWQDQMNYEYVILP